jgi:predicted helicase
MRIAMELKETGYKFPTNRRLQVFLTNSLIEGKQVIENENDPLEIESVLAESIRQDSKINVVIGSPPFHADSKNQNEWIMALMESYKREPGSTERLRERNPKLINDDYVKFIRLAEDTIKNQEDALVAYIIPFSYASNLTFRGMRWNLLKQFSEIYILNLHGNVMGRDAADSAERDENILDIQLGVCISFFVKKKGENTDFAKVFYSDFSGSREKKYQFLLNTKFESIKWIEVKPVAPYYFFKPVDLSQADAYNTGVSLADLFPAYLGGVKTHDDGNLVSYTPFDTGYDCLYDYRPFDTRHINYDRKKVSRDR